MKNLNLLIVLFLVTTSSFGQTWDQTGNGQVLPALPLLGTTNARDLRIVTNGVQRMWLNQNLTNNINSQGNANRSGFLGLGGNIVGSPANSWNTNGPISLLHLMGESNILPYGGYRNWMRHGISLTHNNDLMWMGQRRNGAEFNDVTDAVIAWADNPGNTDNLLFTFITGTGANNNDLTGDAPNGREIMRLTTDGNVGIGPRFSNAAQPQSQLHINGENAVGTWLQLSNQTGTGMAATDGLRLGVLNTGTAEIRQQENQPLKLFTNSVERIHVNANVGTGPNYNRNGFIGLNNSDPRFHLDILTPVSNSDVFTELIFRARTAEDLNAYFSIFNFGGGSGIFVPALFGRQSNNINSAFNTCGSITNAQDISTNAIPVTRFFSTRNFDPTNAGSILERINVVQNRRIFGWFNGVDQLMTMEANGFLGIGTTNPGNRLEINSDFYLPNGNPGSNLNPDSPNPEAQAPGFGNPTGFSGLRFSDLTSLSTPAFNPGKGVLAVNGTGDVIYVPYTPNTGFGAQCGNAASATLTQNTEVPLGNFNLMFSGQSATADRVGIGIQGCNPNAKLDVLQTTGNNQTVINALNTAPISGSYSFGQGGIAVKGHVETGDWLSCEALSVGGLFTSRSMALNIGVAGLARGVNGDCNTTNFGGYFVAENGAGGNTAIYAQADLSIPGNQALVINGNANITGGLWSASDAQLKSNVNSIQNATQVLSQLNPVTYTFNQNVAPKLELPSENQFGLIAQELQVVLPDLVRTASVPKDIQFDSTGIVTGAMSTGGVDEISVVNYNQLIPILIAGFKEQNERINQLQSQLQACCTAGEIRSAEYENHTGAVVPVRLHSDDAPRLGQNIPNPFDVQTRIPVYLPVSVAKAEIIFYSAEGKVIQNLLLFDRGEFSVSADAETLASGIYSYTLYVDGKPVETKRMVKR